jgi:hypothetical protein
VLNRTPSKINHFVARFRGVGFFGAEFQAIAGADRGERSDDAVRLPMGAARRGARSPRRPSRCLRKPSREIANGNNPLRPYRFEIAPLRNVVITVGPDERSLASDKHPVTMSVTEMDNEKLNLALDSILSTWQQGRRVLVVIGAGASVSAGIPDMTAVFTELKTAVEEMKKKFVLGEGYPQGDAAKSEKQRI